jgi:hypothetical protein
MTRSLEAAPAAGESQTLNRPYPSLNGDIAPRYESSLSLIGEVRLSSDNLSASARLIAMVDGERRGVAEVSKVGDRQMFFLPVYSNAANETVSFMLENDGREIPLREQIQYRANAVVGSISSPMLLTDASINLKVYPNPFTDRITVSFDVEEPNARIRVELISINGARVYSTAYTTADAGPQHVFIDGAAIANLIDGAYLIRVTLNGSITSTNIVIKQAVK